MGIDCNIIRYNNNDCTVLMHKGTNVNYSLQYVNAQHSITLL